MNFERHPFNGGVAYVDPLYPRIAVVGYYHTDQLEHECTYWEVQGKDGHNHEEGFWDRESAMRWAED